MKSQLPRLTPAQGIAGCGPRVLMPRPLGGDLWANPNDPSRKAQKRVGGLSRAPLWICARGAFGVVSSFRALTFPQVPKGAPKSIPQVFQHTGLLQPSGPQKYDMGGSGRGRSNLPLRVTDSSEKKPGFGSAKRTALVSLWFHKVLALNSSILALWAVESFAISTASGFHYLHGIARPSVRVALAERGRKGLQRLERPGILTLL